MSIHLVLLVSSCCAFAAAAAGGQLGGLTADTARARQMAMLVSASLMLGNAACLLPDTPAWYSVAVVALTFGGLVWLAVSMLAAVRGRAAHAATPYVVARPAAAATRLATPRSDLHAVISPVATDAPAQLPAAATARPHLAVLPGGLARPEAAQRPAAAAYPVVEATVTGPAPSHGRATTDAPYLSERSLLTRADLDTIGSPAARAQNVQIARYVGREATKERRAPGSAFPARVPSPDLQRMRAQLRAVYADAPATTKSAGRRA